MEYQGIGYEELRISTFDVKEILELEMDNTINEHGTLYLKALAEDINETIYIEKASAFTPIEVYYVRKERNSLFNGYITNIHMTRQNEGYILVVEAKSYTFRMDLNKKNRSFQDITMTSHELINEVMKAYPNSFYQMNIPNEPIGEFVLQYEETDWIFIRRFISRYH